MPLPLDDVLSILRDHVSDPKTVKAITLDLVAAEKEVKQEREATAEPKAKKRFVVLLRGDAILKPALEGGAWIVAIPEGQSAEQLLGNVSSAVRASNDALKRNRASRVIKTFARAMEWLKPKAIKTAADGDAAKVFAIKTKTPVEIVLVEREEIS